MSLAAERRIDPTDEPARVMIPCACREHCGQRLDVEAYPPRGAAQGTATFVLRDRLGAPRMFVLDAPGVQGLLAALAAFHRKERS